MADQFNRRWFLRQAGLGLAAAPVLRAARRPNIVLIYADDVGYGDIGCYGATAVRTPNLDRIAGQGVRFTNAHATSATCTPSRFSLLTGEYAWRQQGTGILPGDAPLIIPPGRLTLPGILRSAGYRTAVVGKWHLGLGAGKIDWNGDITPGPNEIGFDYSFIIPATPDRVPCVLVENHRVVNLDPAAPISVSYQQPFPGELTGHDHPELLKMKLSHGHDGAIVNGVSRIGFMQGGGKALWVDENFADIFTRKATDFVDAHRSEPFFLYYAAHEIHVPRLPNPRFVGSTGMGPRGDSIAELDWCVGRILDALERNGLTRDTLVLFSSDNGPVLDDGYRDQAVERVGNAQAGRCISRRQVQQFRSRNARAADGSLAWPDPRGLGLARPGEPGGSARHPGSPHRKNAARCGRAGQPQPVARAAGPYPARPRQPHRIRRRARRNPGRLEAD